MLKRRQLILGLAVFSDVRPAWPHSYKLGAIAIGHAWALPSDGTDTEVCFPLSNAGKEPDELIEATSPIASKVEFRANNDYSGEPLASIVIEPGKPLPMRPKARHLRLVGLTRHLNAYDSVPLTLHFKKAGKITIEVLVKPPE